MLALRMICFKTLHDVQCWGPRSVASSTALFQRQDMSMSNAVTGLTSTLILGRR